MDNTQPKATSSSHKGRWVLLGLFIFFAIPVILVIVMIKMNYRPHTIEIEGQLITPPHLIQLDHKLQVNDGKVFTDQAWQDHWTMLYVAENCAEQCALRLKDMRQLHVSLAQDIPRVQRVLVTAQADVSQIQSIYPELYILHDPAPTIKLLIAELSQLNKQKDNFMMIVDPFGSAMMSYHNKIEAIKIRKDLVRLLKFAWAA